VLDSFNDYAFSGKYLIVKLDNLPPQGIQYSL